MFRTLTIEGYRGIDKLSLDNLARINLLVGRNNCGKTSVLEAVELLMCENPGEKVPEIAKRRGDLGVFLDIAGERVRSANFGNFFRDWPHGNKKLRLRAEDTRWFELTAGQHGGESGNGAAPRGSTMIALERRLGDGFGEVSDWEGQFKVNQSGFLVADYLQPPPNGTGWRPAVEFVSANGPTVPEVRRWLSSVKQARNQFDDPQRNISAVLAMTGLVLPGVEIVDFTDTDEASRASRSGVYAVGRDWNRTFAQVGEGAWRALGLAAAAATAGMVRKNSHDGSHEGTLLVDEFDTGLHYSALPGVWSVLRNIAAAYAVQVFATTHSEDCVRAFAEVAQECGEGEMALYRIERGTKGLKGVRFGKDNLSYVLEHDSEVR